MATGQTFVHCFILMVSYVLVVQATKSPKQVTIDAALRYKNPLNVIALIHDEGILLIATENVEPENVNKEYSIINRGAFVPPEKELKITAATMKSLGEGGERTLFGENNMLFAATNNVSPEVLEYGSDYEFVKDGGPDAVALRGEELIFFKGCKMAVKHKSGDWSEPESVQSLGLPCHPDAAWRDKRAIFILRGDQIWMWKEDDSVDGPHPFNDTYTLISWILKPYQVSCPEEWHLYEDLNMCYILFHDKKTWSNARAACQAIGGDLVTIKDKGTLDFVNDLVKVDYAYYWLGLNDVKTEGKFVWLEETEEATFTHWDSVEPNDYRGEDCVHITENIKFLWNDLGCEAEIGYICQLPATRW